MTSRDLRPKESRSLGLAGAFPAGKMKNIGKVRSRGAGGLDNYKKQFWKRFWPEKHHRVQTVLSFCLLPCFRHALCAVNFAYLVGIVRGPAGCVAMFWDPAVGFLTFLDLNKVPRTFRVGCRVVVPYPCAATLFCTFSGARALVVVCVHYTTPFQPIPTHAANLNLSKLKEKKKRLNLEAFLYNEMGKRDPCKTEKTEATFGGLMVNHAASSGRMRVHF